MDAQNEANHALLERVNRSGQAFLIHSKVDGEVFLRLAVGGFSQTIQHIDNVWELLCQSLR